MGMGRGVAGMGRGAAAGATIGCPATGRGAVGAIGCGATDFGATGAGAEGAAAIGCGVGGAAGRATGTGRKGEAALEPLTGGGRGPLRCGGSGNAIAVALLFSALRLRDEMQDAGANENGYFNGLSVARALAIESSWYRCKRQAMT